jgi:predicted lipoprotein with Yx(FWY)xxD motif
MGISAAAVRRVVLASLGIIGLSGIVLASPADAAPAGSSASAAVVDALSTTAYGSVLVVGGSGPLAGSPLYMVSSDADGSFGCTTTLETTFQGPLTCTGPESDLVNGVQSDEWPAFTTAGWPRAGSGVDRDLLGTVYRHGIGRQVTYAGHPLYLFDPPSSPFVPFGEGFFESVLPLPPWHGIWDLVSARWGQPDTGVATIETETLPDGKTAVAAETYPNAVPGGVAITTYSFSRDDRWDVECTGECAVTWIPVLTTGPPQVAGGVDADDVGVVRRPDGTHQVTYHGKPLYLYSAEQPVFTNPTTPQTTGSAGNGDGMWGPHGGRFWIVRPD